MRKYTNEYGKPVWEGVSKETAFSEDLFHGVDNYDQLDSFCEPDHKYAFHSDLGSITVLDRMTGYGYRDIETGYRDQEGFFWLASGGYDVRDLKADVIARTAKAGWKMLKYHPWEGVMFDHDLGDDVTTGYTLLKGAIEYNCLPPTVILVTSNPVGKANMIAALLEDGYERCGEVTYKKV